MVELAETVWRDWVTDGVPSSGEQWPRKRDIREWGTNLELYAQLISENPGLIFPDKATMDSILTYGQGQMAWVLGDATAANNGVYRKLGASGVGSWVRLGDLPYSFIKASDAGAGTANAIVATTSTPIPAADGAALIALNIFEANTASPVTVAFNGGSALTIKTNTGNDIASGGLTAGMIVAGYVSGATFRLLSDQASAAIIAAAEAAQVAAEAARDEAVAAAAGVNLPLVTPGDEGSILVVNSAGSGYALDPGAVALLNLVGDGTTDDTAAWNTALALAESRGVRKIVNRDPSKRFKVIRSVITKDIEIDLGGAALVADYGGALFPNNSPNILQAPGGFATGAFDFTGGGSNLNTFTVGDRVYTITTAGDPAAADQFWRGENAEVSAGATAFALTAAVNGERYKVVSFTGASGEFVAGETLAGGTSGVTGTIKQVFYEPASATDGILFVVAVGNYTGGETLTGGTSGVTATSHGASRPVITTSTTKNPKARAKSVAGVVTITALKEGTAGNAIALAETSTSATVSGATLTGGAEPISITIRNGVIDGQNDGGAQSGAGEPMVQFIGGSRIIFDNVEFVNGAMRSLGADVIQRRLDYRNAEIHIEDAQLVQVFGGKMWSSSNEMLQIQSWDGSTVYQIIGTWFSKRRSYNKDLMYSNSSFNALNCHPSSFMIGCQFFDHIKSAVNISHHGGTFINTHIENVWDSSGIDFNEAASHRFNGAKLINTTLRNVIGVGIRASGSNVSIDGVDEENCVNAVRFESDLANINEIENWYDLSDDLVGSCEVKRVTSRGAGVWLAYDAQTAAFTKGKTLTGGTSGATSRIMEVYDNSTTGVLLLTPPAIAFQNNETVTDSGGGSALANGVILESNAVIDVRGVSSSLPTQLHVEGMLDKLTSGLQRANIGVDAGNCALYVDGILEVGDGQLVRQDGYARTNSKAMFRIDKDAGTRHAILYDGATIENITLEDYRRIGALQGGASDIRFLGAPTLTGAIHLLRPITTPVTNDATKPIVLNGMMQGSVAYNPNSLDTATSEAVPQISVPGAAIGDAVELAFSPSLQGLHLTGYVSAAGLVDGRLHNETGGTVNLDAGTLYAYVKRRT